MRIVSMLSSATEIVYELGLQDHLVAISHECDYPPGALRLPRLSRPRFDPEGLTSAEVDAAVRRAMEEHGSVYEVDADALRAARPDVVLTQAVCEVCAVPTGSVEQAVAGLPHRPVVASLDAHTLEEILGTVLQVAEAAGAPAAGQAAVARLRERMEQVRAAVAGRSRPKVLALEWLDPPFAPGHWVPEMVETAGGENLLGLAGGHSAEIPWSRAAGLEPDCLLLVPCGYSLARAREDASSARKRLKGIASEAIAAGGAAVGDSAYFSRSGPRVVDGIEALAAWLHPEAAVEAPRPGILEPWR